MDYLQEILWNDFTISDTLHIKLLMTLIEEWSSRLFLISRGLKAEPNIKVCGLRKLLSGDFCFLKINNYRKPDVKADHIEIKCATKG